MPRQKSQAYSAANMHKAVSKLFTIVGLTPRDESGQFSDNTVSGYNFPCSIFAMFPKISVQCYTPVYLSFPDVPKLHLSTARLIPETDTSIFPGFRIN